MNEFDLAKISGNEGVVCRNGKVEAATWADPTHQQGGKPNKNILLSHAPHIDIDVPRLSGELYDFQKSSVAYCLKNKRVIVGEPTGAGKTVIACGVVSATDNLPIVVVAPKSLVPVWQSELNKWCRNVSSIQVIESVDDRIEHKDATILSYGMLSFDASQNEGRLCKQLCGLSPKMFIADEAHALRGESLRSYSAERIAKRAEYRMLLTGTPIVKNEEDVPRLLSILGRKKGLPKEHTNLNRYLRSKCYTRHKREVVLSDLPDRIRRSPKIEISNRSEYEALKERYRHELTEEAGFKALYEFRKAAALGKLDYVEDLTDQLNSPVVLFAIHRKVQRELLRRFPDAPRVVSEQSTQRRTDMIKRFQRGDHEAIIVAIGSTPEQSPGGVGIELTAANHGIFCELGWTHAHMVQAGNRIHRMGQQNPVQLWYPIAANTIDEDIWKLIQDRKVLTEKATTGTPLQEIKNELWNL